MLYNYIIGIKLPKSQKPKPKPTETPKPSTPPDAHRSHRSNSSSSSSRSPRTIQYIRSHRSSSSSSSSRSPRTIQYIHNPMQPPHHRNIPRRIPIIRAQPRIRPTLQQQLQQRRQIAIKPRRVALMHHAVQRRPPIQIAHIHVRAAL